MDFNIKASKGRCPAPKTLLSVPPSLARHCSVFPTAARAQVPPCYLAAGGDQAGQTPECHLPEFPLLSKLQGNWKISPRATLTFLKSWMEVWDIPLLNKQNKINWSDDVVLLHFLRDRGLPGEQRETMGMGKGPALTSSSERGRWRGQASCGGEGRMSLPGCTRIISNVWCQAPERPQSSVTGGGMSCSWKFSFWKMLLKAGPLWEPLNGL